MKKTIFLLLTLCCFYNKMYSQLSIRNDTENSIKFLRITRESDRCDKNEYSDWTNKNMLKKNLKPGKSIKLKIKKDSQYYLYAEDNEYNHYNWSGTEGKILMSHTEFSESEIVPFPLTDIKLKIQVITPLLI